MYILLIISMQAIFLISLDIYLYSKNVVRLSLYVGIFSHAWNDENQIFENSFIKLNNFINKICLYIIINRSLKSFAFWPQQIIFNRSGCEMQPFFGSNSMKLLRYGRKFIKSLAELPYHIYSASRLGNSYFFVTS